MIRLDKYLADMGIGTRSEVKNIIRKKQVSVNGMPISKPEAKVDITKDTVCYQGKTVAYEPYVYYMLNKPPGVLTAVKDNNYKTVMDIMDVTPKEGLFPVGRLDKDTEGLLLITNDGELSHNLLSPKKHVNKTYYVELNGELIDSDIDLFAKGLDIGEKNITKPAKLEILSGRNRAYITIIEGKYHQVKRMFQAIGLTVTFLKRISMGSLILDKNLKSGGYRKLTEEEISNLKSN